MPLTILLTLSAVIAFAANSLLARLALAGHWIDAGNFTSIRLVSGALALVVLLMCQRGRVAGQRLPGNWWSALCLFVYALAFSFAYLRLGAATGALILFAAVQGSMICWAAIRRDTPTIPETIGLVIAGVSLVYLLLPGIDTPDFRGSLLMLSGGIAWGMYTLRGRGAKDPTGETAGNFVRSAVFCLPLLPLSVLGGHITGIGFGLAVISGVVTSGLGYAIWYRALPGLSTAQAAAVQLTVPIIAAIGAVLLLSEPLTFRLVLASICLLGGVSIALFVRKKVLS